VWAGGRSHFFERIWSSLQASAIRLPAIEDADDADRFFILPEADAIIADAQAENRRVNALEFLDVDGTALGQPVNSLPNSASDAIFEFREIVKRGLVPPDLLHLKPVNPDLNGASLLHAGFPYRRFA
jgi:hypothetical protein